MNYASMPLYGRFPLGRRSASLRRGYPGGRGKTQRASSADNPQDPFVLK